MLNDLLGRVIALFFGFAAISGGGFDNAQNTQVGAAASTISPGKCQQAYEKCMHLAGGLADPNMGAKDCDSTWEKCITRKCVVQRTATERSCPKDQDCESFCTEFATSKQGLGLCCLGGPKRNNSCRKEIDYICNPGTPSAHTAFPGAQYNDGDIIPPRGAFPSISVDPRMSLDPSLSLTNPGYPEATTFSESGLPSNPPSEKPISRMTELDPNWVNIQQYAQQLGYQNLPPEFQPAMPYTPSVTDSQFPRRSIMQDGVTYSVPTPVYTTQDGGLSASPPNGAQSYSGNATFSEPVSAVSPVAAQSTCHVRFLKWCLW